MLNNCYMSCTWKIAESWWGMDKMEMNTRGIETRGMNSTDIMDIFLNHINVDNHGDQNDFVLHETIDEHLTMSYYVILYPTVFLCPTMSYCILLCLTVSYCVSLSARKKTSLLFQPVRFLYYNEMSVLANQWDNIIGSLKWNIIPMWRIIKGYIRHYASDNNRHLSA